MRNLAYRLIGHGKGAIIIFWDIAVVGSIEVRNTQYEGP